MLIQLSHNRLGRINLRPMDVDDSVTSRLSLRSVHSAEVFMGNIMVHEYGSTDGPLYQYTYALGREVQLRKEHTTDSLKMMVVVEGRLVLSQGLSEDCAVPEGIVCLFRSRDYTIQLPGKCKVRYLIFNIEHLVERLQLQGFIEGRYPLTGIMQAQVAELLNPPRILALPEVWLTGQLTGMVYQLHETIEREQRLSPQVYHMDYALAADVFIQRNLLKDHTLKEISRQVGLNETDLKAAYKVYFGVGMAKRQNMLRVEMAKKLMLQTNKLTRDIAIECGYNNTRSFYNNFKEETNLKPVEWRQKYSI